MNQLQHVIDTYKLGNHRHSALQASIFDPSRDHTNSRRRGFPCLQQVAFGVSDGTLELTGFLCSAASRAESLWELPRVVLAGKVHGQADGLAPLAGDLYCFFPKLPLGDGYSKSGLTPLKNSLKQIVDQHALGTA